MFRLLGGLAYYLKWQEISTASLLFRVHNNFTSVVLLTCSIIITANQFVGNPISCIVGHGLPQHVINTYCWITSTFTMPDAFSRQVGYASFSSNPPSYFNATLFSLLLFKRHVVFFFFLFFPNPFGYVRSFLLMIIFI